MDGGVQESVSIPLRQAAALHWHQSSFAKPVSRPLSFRVLRLSQDSLASASARLPSMRGFVGAVRLQPSGCTQEALSFGCARDFGQDATWVPRLGGRPTSELQACEVVGKPLDASMSVCSPWLLRVGPVHLPVRAARLFGAAFAPVSWPGVPPPGDETEEVRSAEENAITLLRRVMKPEHCVPAVRALTRHMPASMASSVFQENRKVGASRGGLFSSQQVDVSRVSKWHSRTHVGGDGPLVHCNNWQQVFESLGLPRMPHRLVMPALAVECQETGRVVIFTPAGVSVSGASTGEELTALLAEKAPAVWGSDTWPINSAGVLVAEGETPELPVTRPRVRVHKPSVHQHIGSVHASALDEIEHSWGVSEPTLPILDHPRVPFAAFLAMKFYGK